MDTGNRSRLLRSFAEVMVIITGILLALAAEAAWTGRQDAVRELQYLRTLEAELAAADSVLSFVISYDSTRADWAAIAARVMVSDGPLAAADSMWASGALGVSFEESSAATGTVSTLIQTGDITLIRSPEIGSRIGELHAWLEASAPRLRYSEEMLLQSFLETQRISARLQRDKVPFSGVLPILRQNPDFIGAVATRSTVLELRVQIHGQIRERVRRLREMVSGELAARSAS